MSVHKWGRFARGMAASLVGFAVLAATPAPSAQEPSRDQQIADLEKQIKELGRKLDELKQKPVPAPAKPSAGLPADWVQALHWRCIGPAAMGGRITDLAVYEADPTTFWVATASGGLLKTVNNGTTFEHQFDREGTVSIGAVAVAPSDRNVVWIGTGEGNPRNSVSYGDGVYKSTDGGKTWKHVGLNKSFQTGRIVIHPKDPNTVYVGVLGRLYGPNEERGLFKTTDGGKSWTKVLYVDEKTGVIDLRLSPDDPETLLVATWERKRDAFDSFRGDATSPDGEDNYAPAVKWGPGSGIHKSTDGGKTWHKVTKGLPTSHLGRIGLDYSRKEPKTVFAIVDCEKLGVGPPQPFLGVQGLDAAAGGAAVTQVLPDTPAAKAGLKPGDAVTAVDKKEVKAFAQLGERLKDYKVGDKVTLTVRRGKETVELPLTLEKRPGPAPRPFSSGLGGQRENEQDKQGPDGFEYGGVYKSADGGETWSRVNSLNPRPMYFSQVRVDPTDDKRLYVLGISMYRSEDGGKTFKPDAGNGVHPDQHALWIDPRDGRHMIVGCDGGFYATYDRAAHWDYLNTVAIAQFYHVAVDNRRPYRAYGGLQDNGSWGGPSHVLHGPGPVNDDWIVVGGGDGFYCAVDLQDPDIVYYESQDGNIARRNLHTGEGTGLQPKDPSAPPSPPGGEGGAAPRQGRRPPPAAGGSAKPPKFRFNWNTPFLLSHANSHIFYCVGNYVFRSLNQGNELRPISPEITRTKRGSGTALAESPKNPDVLWAGTDDGALWVTRDGGAKWTNVADKLIGSAARPGGLPGPRWVASIEASRFAEGRAYVAFDAHRSDDDEPYLFVTEDYGESWKPLRNNLPTGSTRVLREDVGNENLLYVGTEFAVWASLDRGATWTKINNNLPTVAVHELAVHPTAGEIVAATHGRSLWVLDVTALRQAKPETFTAKATLFRPAAVTRWRSEPQRGSPYGMGSRRFVGENPPPGAQIYYALGAKAGKAEVRVYDFAGKVVREVAVSTDPGLHRIGPAPGGGPGRPGGPGAGRGGLQARLRLTAAAAGPGVLAAVPPRPGGPGGFRPDVPPPGMYRVVLIVDGKEFTQPLRVEADPTLATPLIASDGEAPDFDEDD